jgi:hypothetical protein
MRVVNLHSFFEDLQENQEEMALQVVREKQEKMVLREIQGKQEKMALQEVQEEMAGTEGMVHREPEVF